MVITKVVNCNLVALNLSGATSSCLAHKIDNSVILRLIGDK